MKFYDLIDTFYWMNWRYDRMREPKRLGIMLAIIAPWLFLSVYHLLFYIPVVMAGLLRWYWLNGNGSKKWRKKYRISIKEW